MYCMVPMKAMSQQRPNGLMVFYPFNQQLPFSNTGNNYEKNRKQLKNVQLYKTVLCKSFEERGHCNYDERCQFAHGTQELRAKPEAGNDSTSKKRLKNPKYKTILCDKFKNGHCPYGSRCQFIHDEICPLPVSYVPMFNNNINSSALWSTPSLTGSISPGLTESPLLTPDSVNERSQFNTEMSSLTISDNNIFMWPTVSETPTNPDYGIRMSKLAPIGSEVAGRRLPIFKQITSVQH